MPINLTIFRRYLLLLFLQAYAILLALVQSLGGVRTDEAKYLLNIPYPHPPALRFVMGLTESMPFQELFWRLILATALVHAVWFVWDMARGLTAEKRLTLCALWLSAGGLLFQAGTVMMAPVTALQGLVFVWLLFSGQRSSNSGRTGWIALFWLASLFTAYQAVLFLPLIPPVLRKYGLTWTQAMIATCVPVALLVMYVGASPLAALSFLQAGDVNSAVSGEGIFNAILKAWLIAGSGVLSVIGTYGIVRSKNIPLLLSFILLCIFLSVSFKDYYAVIFLPLFIGGAVAYSPTLHRSHGILAVQLVCAVVLFAQTPLTPPGSTPARRVMGLLSGISGDGAVLIHGSFGHEWQYESTSPILRYRPALLSKAKAVVCLLSCPEVAHYGFYQVLNIGEEVWVRK